MKSISIPAPNRRLLFTPGPATTSETVKAALITEDMSPRDTKFVEVIKDLRTRISQIAANPNNYTTVLFSASGTGAVEAMLLAAARQPKKILIVNNGAYGHRMSQMAEAYQLSYEEFSADPLAPLPLNELDSYLAKNADQFAFIAVVHHETTTGLLNPLSELGDLAKRHQLELLVDAMSSFAALPIDMPRENIALLASSSNKNLQGMAGAAFVIAQRITLEKLAQYSTKSFYLDAIAEYYALEKSGQGRFTLPVQVLFSLRQALDEFEAESQQQRCSRYQNNWQQLNKGIANIGFDTLLTGDIAQSQLLLSIRYPQWPGFSFSAMSDDLKQYGIDVYPGKLPGAEYFRLCTIGDLYLEDIQSCLEHLENYCQPLREAASLEEAL